MMRISTFHLLVALLLGLSIALPAADANAVRVRIKDVARVQGVERYTLTGYGLVVGLNGSGDSDEDLTQQTIASLLENFNIAVDPSSIKAQNTAVVMVTGNVETSSHSGDMIPATISSLGDATSLTGGELLLTPVLGPDGEIWASGQGAVSTGGHSVGSSGSGGDSQTKNHPTTGTLTNGVKLERDVSVKLEASKSVSLLLKRPDFTTAVNMAEAINAEFPNCAIPADRGSVRVTVPRTYLEEQTVPKFISELEQVRFVPDNVARVVFNERTGTIVFGGNVQISQVAITHGNLTISIKNTEGVSQPAPLSGGTTERMTDQQTTVNEERVPIHLLPNVTTVAQLVSSLNALGVTPRDTIVILHALREAGALHAKLESI
jgi:flagellar P-ring protein precursor FlgI